ncbi:uncharacterized protein BHQ10_008960 [Talaromyces amestolkiae]|uniref:Uncharacterized protein n=1 Tax=Talaromyces amestolkiae TaxID=1196081 RepID=A0A364LAX4_TALAM|nr:uncharacterized protein BHQ10_008960 [Talaromyces amestolkiae]RAO72948.1 hypothetical protein BHQ10_008960 [Talaromyces amestolkiae]
MAHDGRYAPYRSSGYDDRILTARFNWILQALFIYDLSIKLISDGRCGKTMHEMLLEGPLATEDPSIRKIETTEKVATTTAALPRHLVVADKQATETAIAKDIARQNTTIAAAEAPVAAGVEVETVTAIVIVETFRKVERL